MGFFVFFNESLPPISMPMQGTDESAEKQQDGRVKTHLSSEDVVLIGENLCPSRRVKCNFSLEKLFS